MKTGIVSDAYIDRYGIDAGLARLRAHGYEAIDYQGFIRAECAPLTLCEKEFEKTVSTLGTAVKAAGVEVYQAHAPWRFPLMDFTKKQREERFAQMAKAIRGCAMLDCHHFVVHNLMPYGRYDLDARVVCEINGEYFTRLAEIAHEHGVVICLENMPFRHQVLATPYALLDFVKELNTPDIRMCLDTGHCTMFGISPADAVRAIGKDYLRAVHVHDNDGAHDQHLFPFDGVIDWANFAAMLQEIGFTGVLSLETQAKKIAPPEALWEDEEKRLAALALRLAGRI